jgi:hypothetical protein
VRLGNNESGHTRRHMLLRTNDAGYRDALLSCEALVLEHLPRY